MHAETFRRFTHQGLLQYYWRGHQRRLQSSGVIWSVTGGGTERSWANATTNGRWAYRTQFIPGESLPLDTGNTADANNNAPCYNGIIVLSTRGKNAKVFT